MVVADVAVCCLWGSTYKKDFSLRTSFPDVPLDNPNGSTDVVILIRFTFIDFIQ